MGAGKVKVGKLEEALLQKIRSKDFSLMNKAERSMRRKDFPTLNEIFQIVPRERKG